MKKRKIKPLYLGIGLLLMLVFSLFVAIYNSEDGIEAELVEIPNVDDVMVKAGDFSSNLPFLNDGNGQAFVFVDETSDNYKNYKSVSGGTKIYQHLAGQSIYVGGECKVGNAVRTLYCENTGVGSYSCQKDMFANMFYILKTGDYLYLSDFYNHNDDFYFTYMCYEYDTSITPELEERNVWVQSSNTCMTAKEAIGLGPVSSFNSEKECLDYVAKQTPEDNSGDTTAGHYGYFKNVKYNNEVEQYGSLTVTGDFVVTGDHEAILIESNINKDSFQPFATITADSSVCDGSGYYASDIAYNLKDGDVISFKLTTLVPSDVGKYDIHLYAGRGTCYRSSGYDYLSVNDLSNEVNVIKKEFSNIGDKDGDTIEDGLDNCPYLYNKEQNDLDGDNVGDGDKNSNGQVTYGCDICPYDKGIADIDSGVNDGCHPCIGKSETDVCWDKYSDNTEVDDVRNQNNEDRSIDFDAYLKFYLSSLEEKANKQLEEQCAINGGDWTGSSCKKDEGEIIPENTDGSDDTSNLGPVITDPIPIELCGVNGCIELGKTEDTPTTCGEQEFIKEVCPNSGEEIVSQVCYQGEFKTIKSCGGASIIDDLENDTGFLSQYGKYIGGGIGVVALILGGMFLI